MVESKRTALRTVRIPDQVESILVRDADDRGVSVNTLISSILTRFAEWDRFAEKTQRVSFSHSHLHTLVESASPEKIEKTAGEAATRFADLAQFMMGSADPTSVLRVLELCGKYAGVWSMEKKLNGEQMVLSFYHSLGRNYSQFLKRAVESAIRKVGYPLTEIRSDDHIITIVMALADYKATKTVPSDLFAQIETRNPTRSRQEETG